MALVFLEHKTYGGAVQQICGMKLGAKKSFPTWELPCGEMIFIRLLPQQWDKMLIGTNKTGGTRPEKSS